MLELIYITTKTKKEAKKIAKILVKEKLAACCNVFPIESIYRWRGKIENAKEFGMFVKTKKNLVEKIIKRAKDLHSYDIPCIISLPIRNSNKDFLKWIKRETK